MDPFYMIEELGFRHNHPIPSSPSPATKTAVVASNDSSRLIRDQLHPPIRSIGLTILLALTCFHQKISYYSKTSNVMPMLTAAMLPSVCLPPSLPLLPLFPLALIIFYVSWSLLAHSMSFYLQQINSFFSAHCCSTNQQRTDPLLPPLSLVPRRTALSVSYPIAP